MEETQFTSNQNTGVQKTQSLAIPISIILGFGLIAAAIFFSGKGAGAPVVMPNIGDTPSPTEQGSPEAINPVTEDDHIRGNPNAQLVLVEYSDYDCPFCKNFHETMNQVMEEYGEDGRVAWVYRHFPLEQLHPNAPRIAQSAECVAKLGGNDAFWSFSDLIFGERETNAQTNPVLIPDFAVASGVELDAFNSCLESGETKGEVEEDFTNAIAIGGRGTPHTIVMVGGQQAPINGAQPFEVVKTMIDNLLAQLDGGSVAQ
ncbi:MAG: protein-disulfide isomerase [Candidatus Azotimanducaceae bacterium]|jgi:protein-disulfide isomerase